MKHLLLTLSILLVTFLSACNNDKAQIQKQLSTWQESNETYDSLKVTKAYLSTPIEIYELKNLNGLTITSGVVSHSDINELCVQGDSSGFYGFYYLIDNSINKPLGTLKIHTTDENWKFDSKHERFAEIILESNRVSVWDSIKVGLSEKKLNDFIGNRFHYKKGTMIYSELDSYEGIFVIQKDTISKITIRNNCNK